MELEVLKSGPLAISPSVTQFKNKGDLVNILNKDHAESLINKKVLKAPGKKSSKKKDDVKENKAEKKAAKDKDKSAPAKEGGLANALKNLVK